MEIQKIFSDMYDEERIYSVLMNEDEIALFSDLKERRKLNEYLGDRKDKLNFALGKPSKKFNDRSKSDEDYMEFYEGNPLRTRRKVKNALKFAAGLGAAGALSGRSLKDRGIKAAIGAGVGAGLSYGINKWGDRFAKKKLKEDPHFYDVEKEYLKYKHGNSTKKKVEKKIMEEYKRNEASKLHRD